MMGMITVATTVHDNCITFDDNDDNVVNIPDVQTLWLTTGVELN